MELELRRGSCGILLQQKNFTTGSVHMVTSKKFRNKEVSVIWDEYNSSQSKDSYTALVEYYQPLVRKVAEAVAYSLPVYVDLDDLISEGQLGLLSAIQRYENQGYKFETYANLRIRGAIIDKLRVNDWAPRSLRTSLKRIDEAEDELTSRFQREPTESEIADELDVSLDTLSELRGRGQRTLMGHLDEVTASEGEMVKISDLIADPSAYVDSDLLEPVQDRLVEALEGLHPVESGILVLYYVHEMPLKQIGSALRITDARVSQLLVQALAAVRLACVS